MAVRHPSNRIHVTRHALRRYAERVAGYATDERLSDLEALRALRERGVDLKALRARLVDVATKASAMPLTVGIRKFRVVVDDMHAQVRDDVITTVMPVEQVRDRRWRHPRHARS